MLDRIFNKWSKWEIYKEDVPMIRFNAFNALGMGSTNNVIVDVMKRTNKYTGLIQYKSIVKH